MGFFKKNVSAKVFGETMAESSIKFAAEQQLPEGEEKIDINQYQTEMFFLDVFANDYVAFQKLNGNSPQKNALLDAFYEALKREQLLHPLLQTRLMEYAAAIQTPPPKSDLHPWWELGKAFAKACNHEMDITYIMMGILQFTNLTTNKAELYEQFKVTA